VVTVGWGDATSQVSSVTDSKGNVYHLAVGPTVLTGSAPWTQSIYYAKNIGAAIAGANVVWTGTSGPGSGFIQRMITNPDSDIVEDQVVTALGSYSATAPLASAGPWVMQMVALRAAGASAPIPTPVPTPTPTATPAALYYVQGNYSTPQSPLTTVTRPFHSAQKAGNLNVVIVGWNDATTLQDDGEG
jgi:hypothetical protein